MADSSAEDVIVKVSIKFLLSNGVTGSLIGSGGSAIKELANVTGAKIHVSTTDEVYPGTNDRVILIVGSESVVSLTQALIWELIAMNMRSIEAGQRSETWSPESAMLSEAFESEDNTPVSARISIPAAVGGLILGRGGASIRNLAVESGATISMTSKDEAIFTQERILSIAGTKTACRKCLSLVLSKLAEDSEINQFLNKGTNYMTNINTYDYVRNGQAPGRRSTGTRNRPKSRVTTGDIGENTGDGSALDDISASTTISMAVPELLIGNILGKNGIAIREITSLSGARITVSSRGEYIEGTTNRLVTIAGPPDCAQTAHHLITQKLHQPPRNYAGNSDPSPEKSN